MRVVASETDGLRARCLPALCCSFVGCAFHLSAVRSLKPASTELGQSDRCADCHAAKRRALAQSFEEDDGACNGDVQRLCADPPSSP